MSTTRHVTSYVTSCYVTQDAHSVLHGYLAVLLLCGGFGGRRRLLGRTIGFGSLLRGSRAGVVGHALVTGGLRLVLLFRLGFLLLWLRLRLDRVTSLVESLLKRGKASTNKPI